MASKRSKASITSDKASSDKQMTWFRADLHLHTPASADYKDKEAQFLDILRRAEYRGIDIIAFTDHNTLNGYVAMMREFEHLRRLEELGRANPEEARLLLEYQRLFERVLVLPGFEFTARFGFHVLGIFAPDTPLRTMEHILLNLNVPNEVIEQGDPAAGSTADVLDAYKLIHDAGGIAIAAHINAAHGVMMRGLDFGGQTRIAYTQDRHLHALELTDLQHKGRGSTQRFFDGTKPEYSRKMHMIQGSDAHSLDSFVEGKNTRFGIGERVTEMLLPERSFQAIRDLFNSTDFSRTRPYHPERSAFDYVQAAREEGDNLVQAFHDVYSASGEPLLRVIADVCAFANTNGGTIYIGVSADKTKKTQGITNVTDAMTTLQEAITRLITPALDVEIDSQETQGKLIVRILVPFGEDRPYAVNNSAIYVRDERESTLALRDEIVGLVKQGLLFEQADMTVNTYDAYDDPYEDEGAQDLPTDPTDGVSPPRAGVEIVDVEERNGVRYFTVRDLRNGNVVKNVTMSSARRLWHYAIKQYESNPIKTNKVQWYNDIGLWQRYEKGGDVRYDLVQRDGGRIRAYYGVTENGMEGDWEAFIPDEA